MPTSSQALTWLKKFEGYESHHHDSTVLPICLGNRLPDVFLHRRGFVGLPASRRQLLQPQNPPAHHESNELAPSTSKFLMLPPISGSSCVCVSGLRAPKKSANAAIERSEGQLTTSDGRYSHAEFFQTTGNLKLDNDWTTCRIEGDTTTDRQHMPAPCSSETSTRTTLCSWSATSLEDQRLQTGKPTSARAENGHAVEPLPSGIEDIRTLDPMLSSDGDKHPVDPLPSGIEDVRTLDPMLSSDEDKHPVDQLPSNDEDIHTADPCTSLDEGSHSVDPSTSHDTDSQLADASISRYAYIHSANPPSITHTTRRPTDPSSLRGVSGRPSSPILREENKERQPARNATQLLMRGPRPVPNTRQRQPLATCILNLNLQDTSKMATNNSSSCMSILSYNHKNGRRFWQLVPNHSSSLNYDQMSAQRLQRLTAGEKRNGCVREPHEANSGPKNNDLVLPSAVVGDDNDETGKEREENTPTNIFHAGPQGPPSTDLRASSRVEQDWLETADSFLGGDSRESSSPEGDNFWRCGVNTPTDSSSQPVRPGKKLMSSGVIDNQSYFFRPGDHSPEEGARFLSPIGFGPSRRHQHGRTMSSDSPRLCSRLEYAPPPFTPQPFRSPAQTWEGDKQTKPGLLPRLGPETKVRESSETLEEQEEPEQLSCIFSPDIPEEEAGSEQQAAEVDDGELAVSAREPAIPPKYASVRMRLQLPPSHPGRLCFRTSLSCCSHSEVVQQIESQAPVRVSWLQYEPVSLHFWEQDKEDYQHLCMWIFELTADSNAADLLLRGFQLRGQHMNVVRLDDIYREEHRAHNMCQQVMAEQRSKSLISSKCSKLALTSMRVA